MIRRALASRHRVWSLSYNPYHQHYYTYYYTCYYYYYYYPYCYTYYYSIIPLLSLYSTAHTYEVVYRL